MDLQDDQSSSGTGEEGGDIPPLQMGKSRRWKDLPKITKRAWGTQWCSLLRTNWPRSTRSWGSAECGPRNPSTSFLLLLQEEVVQRDRQWEGKECEHELWKLWAVTRPPYFLSQHLTSSGPTTSGELGPLSLPYALFGSLLSSLLWPPVALRWVWFSTFSPSTPTQCPGNARGPPEELSKWSADNSCTTATSLPQIRSPFLS